jgi:hypothetical protein
VGRGAGFEQLPTANSRVSAAASVQRVIAAGRGFIGSFPNVVPKARAGDAQDRIGLGATTIRLGGRHVNGK